MALWSARLDERLAQDVPHPSLTPSAWISVKATNDITNSSNAMLCLKYSKNISKMYGMYHMD